MVGAYKPCATFIRLARKIEFSPVFVNISFVGASALAKELGPDGNGVIVSQVVPFPWDASLKVVAEYQAAIKATPDFVSLEGYLVGRLAIAALEKAGGQPTREGLLKVIKQTGKFDIGGLMMTFGPTKNEGLDDVFLTVVQPDGTFKAVEKLSSDYERRRTLSALLKQRPDSPAILMGVLRASASISSDFELASLLVEFAHVTDVRGEMRQLYLTAARSISSDFEYRRALQALLERDRQT